METALTLLNNLQKHAKKYSPVASESILRNQHMNEIGNERLNQKVIDAVLVDFINFIGATYAIDYALYTEDLKK